MNTFNKVCAAFMAAVMLCLVQPHGATIIVRGPIIASAGGGEPTYIISENFEGTGTPSGWVTTGLSFDQSTSGLSLEGSECVSLVGSSGYVVTPSGIAAGEMWLRCRIRFTEDTAGTIIQVNDSSFNIIAYLYRQADGQMEVVVSGGSTAATVAATSINTTYWFWLRYKKGTGANAEAEVWFSETSTKPSDGSNFNAKDTGGTATTDSDHIKFQNDSAGLEHYLDEVRVAASSIP